MPECSWCGNDEIFLYKCDFCGDWFCPEHDKPEDHDCAGQHLTENEGTDGVDANEEMGVKTTDQINFAYLLKRFKNRLLIPVTDQLSHIGLAPIVVFVILVIIVGGVTYYTGYIGATPGFGGLETDPFSARSAPSEQTVDVAELNRTAVERAVFERINQRRSNHGVTPLEYDSRLGEIARYHSEDMGAFNYTGHVSPDGETVRDRYAKFNYTCQTVGELVLHTYYGRDLQTRNGTEQYNTGRELAVGIVRSWMKSETHRATILNESWSKAGVGIYVTDGSKVYVTQNLC